MKTLLSLALAASLVLAGISGQSVVASASTCSTNPYATTLVAYSPPYTGVAPSLVTVPGGAEKVLGAPERVTSFSDVNFDNSGSTPGFVTVGFAAGTMITNGPGPDIRLHFNDLHGEPFSVFASQDGAAFVSLGSWNVAGPASAPSTVDVDLATGGLASARYIKIVNGTVTYGSDAAGTNEGPDIDGIQMLSCGPIATATPTPTPTPISQCQDGIDNDQDGAVDMNDFSCSTTQDNDETNPKSACQDGLDNDSDGLIDLNDPGCASRQDNDETHVIVTPTPTFIPLAQCSNGIDDDGDGFVDGADSGCHTDANPNNPGSFNPNDNNENAAVGQCSDSIDNDGDSATDGADPQCHSDGNVNNINSFDPTASEFAHPVVSPTPQPTYIIQNVNNNDTTNVNNVTTGAVNVTTGNVNVDSRSHSQTGDQTVNQHQSQNQHQENKPVQTVDVSKGQVAGAKTYNPNYPTGVPVTAKTGTGLLSVVSTVLGGLGMVSLRRFA